MGIYIGIIMIIVGTVLATLGLRELIVKMKNAKPKKEGTLPTKLLASLRKWAESRIGVFYEPNGKYSIVYARYYADSLKQYDYNKNKLYPRFELVYEGIESVYVAKQLCEACRRNLILDCVRERRYGNNDRIF